VVRAGLWALPAVAAVMGATAAKGDRGEMVVYALTPLAITAAAEGLAFLARRVVVHQEGRDVEAEARAAAVIRDLAYHQARATGHPSDRARKASVKKSWRLARKVGTGDHTLGAQLLDVQRTRLVAGADVALERMFPGTTTMAPALPPVSAPQAPAILPAPSGDATTSVAHESTIHADTSGYPSDTSSDQAGEAASVRPALSIVRTAVKKGRSMNADVKQMVGDGVQDIRHVIDAVATRHQRDPEDPRFRQTVTRYWRDAQAEAAQAINEADKPSPYL
uniref:conjugal transfer protein n=1 Tax=Streptomyces chryseus TaxID=68186 RepID=UPI0014775813